MTEKKQYPDPDLVFKNVKVMWARTLPSNPYPSKKITKDNGAQVMVAERWSFDVVLSDAQAKAAKAKQAYVKSKVGEEGDQIHFMSFTKNVKTPDGMLAKPFFIVKEDGAVLEEEPANGSIMDVEIYLGLVSEQTGMKKVRLKRGVITDFIPYSSETKPVSVDAEDSSEQIEDEPAPKKVVKSKVASRVDEIADDIPF
jgi:hypothetical protein